ncbi:MAG: MGMT family protein [Anaerolineae bacterium]|nr:MGMT family protein [Anaerolineae bacterium]
MSSYPQPPNPRSFHEIVWEIVRQVPAGIVTTFGQIASMIPTPEGVDAADYQKLGPRWVGDAMNAVSWVDEASVPWHRVINSKGTVSLPEETIAAAQQRSRLRAEGVLDARDHVDLNRYGWEGPDAAWLETNGLLKPRSLKKQPPEENAGQMRLF